MHGSLLDSHHRSSLINSNDLGILSSSSVNHLADDPPIDPIDPSSSTVHLRKPSHTHDEDDQVDKLDPTSSEPPEFFRWAHGHRRVMLTFSTICLFAFMTGVEYAVILPTAFDYVKTMTQVDIYVGLVLSSYSISGSITGIIMGKLSDMTGKVKFLILISNLFAIMGNILYFVTKNIHVVLLGRLVAGVGMGAVPPVS